MARPRVWKRSTPRSVCTAAVTYEYRLAPYYWLVRMLNMVVSKEMILNFVAGALTGITPQLLVSSNWWPR